MERESIINAFKSILSDESKLEEQIITTNYEFDAFVSFHKNDFDFMDKLLKVILFFLMFILNYTFFYNFF